MLHKAQTAAFFAALVATVLLANAWRTARRDSARLATTIAAQQSAIDQASQREKQRDSQLAATLAAIEKKKGSVRTPSQAAAQIPFALPSLPLPVMIHEPALVPLQPASRPNGTPSSAQAESPPAEIDVPQPDLKPLFDELEDCRASSLENSALRQDLADEKKRSASLAAERNATITAARGGSVWARAKHNVKWFALGAVTGVVAVAATYRAAL